ncbi:hypothetical protein GF342_04255 [Candidatus Woesearchaeota archaeon]|nr:hypothetical protein [Candidatus Woesearchaeota archaeon]
MRDDRPHYRAVKPRLLQVAHTHFVDDDNLVEYLSAWWHNDASETVKGLRQGYFQRRLIQMGGRYFKPFCEHSQSENILRDYLSALGITSTNADQVLTGMEKIWPHIWQQSSSLPPHPALEHRTWQEPELPDQELIKKRLRKARHSRNISRKQLGDHLSEHSNYCGQSFCDGLEKGTILEGLRTAHTRRLPRSFEPCIGLYEERIADYLGALGLSKQAYELLEGINQLQPQFLFLHSDIPLYSSQRRQRQPTIAQPYTEAQLHAKKLKEQRKARPHSSTAIRAQQLLINARESKGLSTREAGTLICEQVQLTVKTATKYVESLEKDHVFDDMSRAHRRRQRGKDCTHLDMHQERIAVLLTVYERLDLAGELERIVQTIQPGFDLPKDIIIK